MWVQTTLCTTLFTVANKNYFYTVDSWDVACFLFRSYCCPPIKSMDLLQGACMFLKEATKKKKKGESSWWEGLFLVTHDCLQMEGDYPPGIPCSKSAPCNVFMVPDGMSGLQVCGGSIYISSGWRLPSMLFLLCVPCRVFLYYQRLSSVLTTEPDFGVRRPWIQISVL